VLDVLRMISRIPNLYPAPAVRIRAGAGRDGQKQVSGRDRQGAVYLLIRKCLGPEQGPGRDEESLQSSRVLEGSSTQIITKMFND
jgi:hypothetical protein